MPTPVKISTALYKEARAEATIMDRSITGQIEHWAKLGRAFEATMKPKQKKRPKAAR